MRLFEAIVDANHRAVAGDLSASLCPADYADELPVIALTCVDPRLNPLFPNVLGLPSEQFIWLRNAGNIITAPLSSTMRSLALACAVKGGKEIAIIGHTDCQVAKTTTMQLLERFKALGIERAHLPDNISDYFGVFGNERQNIMKGCEIARNSPLLGPLTPIHGFLVDLATGKLEWIVNGYQNLPAAGSSISRDAQPSLQHTGSLKPIGDFNLGEMKLPDTKIGEVSSKPQDWLAKAAAQAVESSPPPPARPFIRPPIPPKIPRPVVRPRPQNYRGGK